MLLCVAEADSKRSAGLNLWRRWQRKRNRRFVHSLPEVRKLSVCVSVCLILLALFPSICLSILHVSVFCTLSIIHPERMNISKGAGLLYFIPSSLSLFYVSALSVSVSSSPSSLIFLCLCASSTSAAITLSHFYYLCILVYVCVCVCGPWF